MSRKVGAKAASRQKRDFQIRNQNFQNRNPISPVMQKVKGLLNGTKPAPHLHYLTGVPLSTCQKVLSGDRPENLEMIVALLRSEMGREVLFELMGDARPEWFCKYQKQLDINAKRRELLAALRHADELQGEVL